MSDDPVNQTRFDEPAQNCIPVLVMVLTSVPCGQDSAEQSWTPLPKSIFLHKQAMSFGWHPKLEALPNMLLMQFFCLLLAKARATTYALGLFTYTAIRKLVDEAEILGKDQAGEERGSCEGELHC